MGDAGAILIVPVVKSDPRCWALMPIVLHRVRSFCERFDADTPAGVLAQAIAQQFITEDDNDRTIRLLIALRDGQVVGHLVVILEVWCGKVVATISQYELDVAIPRQQLRDAMDQIAWWAKGRGATVMRVLAVVTDEHAKARCRAFRSLYNFEAKRMLMDRSL